MSLARRWIMGSYAKGTPSAHVLTTAGWPKPLEVVPARSGQLRASIKGDALYGTVCGRDYTLTLTTADQFGNPRSAPGGPCLNGVGNAS